MENNTKNLWTKKFKDMTPEEKKLMRKKIIKIFILAFILMIVIVAILPKDNAKEINVYNGNKTNIIGKALVISVDKTLSEQELIDIYRNKINNKDYNYITIEEPNGNGYIFYGSGFCYGYGLLNQEYNVDNIIKKGCIVDKDGEYYIDHLNTEQNTTTQFNINTLTAEQQKIRNDYIAGMKYLYTELQKIKTNPDFLYYGYAQKIGKEWHDQYKQFDSIKEFTGIDFLTQIIPDIDVLPGDLDILAQAYFSSNPDKEYIANTEKRFQYFIDNY